MVSNTVSIIVSSTNNQLRPIDVGDTPRDLGYNPTNEYIYVVNAGSNDVSIIESSTNTVIQTLDVGSTPSTLRYNPISSPGIGDMYVVNVATNDVSVLGVKVNIPPFVDTGPNLIVESDKLVRLDGSNSRDSSDSSEDNLNYKWTQTIGPRVTLDNSTSSNPTFLAPKVNEQTDLTFQLTVTNNEGMTSEPDEVKITVNPTRSATTEGAEDESRTLSDEIKGIVQNPLNITNSIDSAERLRGILTGNN
jgi:YVTN family beta-propeller protein